MAQIIRASYAYITGALSVGNDNFTYQTGSTVFGSYSTANGILSHVLGTYSYASGSYSVSIGYSLNSYNINEVNVGRYNKSYTHTVTSVKDYGWGPYNDSTLFGVGYGSNNDDRKDAFEIRQDGTTYLYGPDTYVAGNLWIKNKVTIDSFGNKSINNYVTYSTGKQITVNNVKYISNINLSDNGLLTYNVGKITYATSAPKGTENKGVVSIDETAVKFKSLTSQSDIWLTCEDGIIKLNTGITPDITLKDTHNLTYNQYIQNFTISTNSFDTLYKVTVSYSWNGSQINTYTNILPSSNYGISLADKVTYTSAKSVSLTGSIIERYDSDTVKNTTNNSGTVTGCTCNWKMPIYASTSLSTTEEKTDVLWANVVSWSNDTNGKETTSFGTIDTSSKGRYVYVYHTGLTEKSLLKYSFKGSANSTSTKVGTKIISCLGKSYTFYIFYFPSGGSCTSITLYNS